MVAIQFAVGAEPVAVRRGGVRGPWLHARIEAVSELDATQRQQLVAWLESIGVDEAARNPTALLICHDGSGNYTVHVDRVAYPVEFGDMPDWLQRETPAPPPRKAVKAQR